MSIKEYLIFTRRERIGIIVLTAILLAIVFLPYLVPRSAERVENFPVPGQLKQSERAVGEEADSLRVLPSDRRQEYTYRYRDRDYGNYGGSDERRFTSRYSAGARADTAFRYKRVSSDRFYQNNFGEGKSFAHNDARGIYRSYAARLRPHYQPIDINTADTAAWIALPGIGSKLANRIVLFREKLGGFSGVAQIAEVYGLRDSVFQQLLPYLRCDSSYAARRNLAAGR